VCARFRNSTAFAEKGGTPAFLSLFRNRKVQEKAAA
jgi:hypothetical protein